MNLCQLQMFRYVHIIDWYVNDKRQGNYKLERNWLVVAYMKFWIRQQRQVILAKTFWIANSFIVTMNYLKIVVRWNDIFSLVTFPYKWFGFNIKKHYINVGFKITHEFTEMYYVDFIVPCPESVLFNAEVTEIYCVGFIVPCPESVSFNA
jgi:hypothetical protein